MLQADISVKGLEQLTSEPYSVPKKVYPEQNAAQFSCESAVYPVWATLLKDLEATLSISDFVNSPHETVKTEIEKLTASQIGVWAHGRWICWTFS